jgi:filamentous hemagglutinin family protein
MLALTAAGFFALPPQSAHAAPQGGQVVAGQATISQPNANTTTITQSSQKAIIDWQSFSIAANQHTQFIQPSAASVTLNRVVGVDPSQILGRLTANGQVFLVNPNGIYFGKNAQIDVAGLIATTHNIRNEDFLAGNYTFNIAGKAGAAVINDGMIHIADTGIAAFVAPSVANRGIIVARLGKVMLASANGFTLDFSGDQLISFLVNDQVAQTAFDLQGKPLTSFVENAGQIQAQGGYVLLTAKAAENAIHSVINQTGSIEATTVGTHNGTIILNAGTGSLNVAGTLDASAPTGGDGGYIDTSGAHLAIDPTAKITTAAPLGKIGKWLIDPVDFIIAATGGNITGAQLAARLAINNIEIQTTGGLPPPLGQYGWIFVNDAVTWNSLSELILTAHHSVMVNSPINATGGGSVRLRADSQGTGVGTVLFGPNGSIAVNVGASVNIYGNGFSPALLSVPFSTIVVNGINPMLAPAQWLPQYYNVVGIYQLINDINQLQLMGSNGAYALGKNIDATATAGWNAGAGFLPIGGTIFGTGGFSGIFNGLDHTINGLTINSPTSFNVGLFGIVNANGVVKNVGLTGGSVTGGGSVGGLAGTNSGSIQNSYNTGTVSGSPLNSSNVGGLVGYNWGGSINNSYATGAVSGRGWVGGLVGGSDWNSLLSSGGSISNSYATGVVTGMNTSGLLGFGYGLRTTITNSYSEIQTTISPTIPSSSLLGGTALTTAQMQQQANFTGWDFVNTWQFLAGASYPTLRPFVVKNVTVITPAAPTTPIITPPVTPTTLTPAQTLLVQQHRNDSTFQLLLAISQGLFTNSNTDPVWVGLYQNGAATANQIAANTQRNIYDAYTAADIFNQIRAGTLVNNTDPTNNNWRVIYRNGKATASQIAANAFDNTYVKYQTATATTLFNGLVTLDISIGPTAVNAVVWSTLVSNNTANTNAAARMWNTYSQYRNADSAALLRGIYAKSFKNDPADPIWRAMYVNGSPTTAQIEANNVWQAAQRAADQAAAAARVPVVVPIVAPVVAPIVSVVEPISPATPAIIPVVDNAAQQQANIANQQAIAADLARLRARSPTNVPPSESQNEVVVSPPVDTLPQQDLPSANVPDPATAGENSRPSIFSQVNSLSDVFGGVYGDTVLFGGGAALLFSELSTLDKVVDATQKKLSEEIYLEDVSLLNLYDDNFVDYSTNEKRILLYDNNPLYITSVAHFMAHTSANGVSEGLTLVSGDLQTIFEAKGIFQGAYSAASIMKKGTDAIRQAINDVTKIKSGVLKGIETERLFEKIRVLAENDFFSDSDPVEKGFGDFKEILSKAYDGDPTLEESLVNLNGSNADIGQDMKGLLAQLKTASNGNREVFYKTGLSLFASLKTAYDASKKLYMLAKDFRKLGMSTEFELSVSDQIALRRQEMIIDKIKREHPNNWTTLLENQTIQKPVPTGNLWPFPKYKMENTTYRNEHSKEYS